MKVATKPATAAAKSVASASVSTSTVQDISKSTALPRAQRRHHEVTVFRRPDRGDSYYFRIRVGGKTITKNTGCTDKKAALKNAALIARAARRHDWRGIDDAAKRPGYATTGQLLSIYEAAAPDRSGASAASRFRRYVSEALSTASPDDTSTRDSLDPKRFRDWITTQERSGRSSAGLHSDVQTIKSIIGRTRWHIYADLKLPAPEPFRAVTGGSSKSEGYQPISRDTLRRMDAAARIPLRRRDPRTWGVYWLMRRAGLRNSEAAALRWSWIEEMPDKSADIVLIERPDWRPKGRSGRVPISRRFLRLLRAALPADPEEKNPYVIPRKNLTEIKKITERTINAFCRPFIPPPGKGAYTLRKEFGSRIAQRDGIEIASALLRHADITTTFQHYHSLLKRPSPL